MIIEFFFSLYLNIYVVVIYWRSYFESHRIKKKKKLKSEESKILVARSRELTTYLSETLV